VWWNLRSEPTKQAKIRTSPEYAPWFSVSLEGRDAPTVGRLGVLQSPGTYTVKIVGTSESQPLVVRKDPNAGGTEATLTENVAAVRNIAADLDSAVTMINALENVRGQLMALKASISSDSTRKDVVTAADSLDSRLRVVERKLFQTRATGRGQDILRWPQRISEQLQYLAGAIESSDFAPTESQRQVAELLRTQLRAVKTEFDRVMAGEVAAFNAMLQQRKVPNVISN
jgi:DNA-binding FrmR family transcriptional regulator